MAIEASLDNGPKTIPFACGTTSGFLNGGADLTFDPNVGVASYAITSILAGAFNVSLGTGSNGSACTVNLTGATPGLYSSTVTLTVAVL